MEKLKYYIFCIRWLYKNKNWGNSRQKFKVMDKDFQKWKGGTYKWGV
jgi:hypothetical protein